MNIFQSKRIYTVIWKSISICDFHFVLKGCRYFEMKNICEYAFNLGLKNQNVPKFWKKKLSKTLLLHESHWKGIHKLYILSLAKPFQILNHDTTMLLISILIWKVCLSICVSICPPFSQRSYVARPPNLVRGSGIGPGKTKFEGVGDAIKNVTTHPISSHLFITSTDLDKLRVKPEILFILIWRHAISRMYCITHWLIKTCFLFDIGIFTSYIL